MVPQKFPEKPLEIVGAVFSTYQMLPILLNHLRNIRQVIILTLQSSPATFSL